MTPHALALQEALDRREEVVPGLLRLLDEVTANPTAYEHDSKGIPHIFALFLLAHFQESKAQESVRKFCSLPIAHLGPLTDDLFLDRGPAVLASVSGGDPRFLLGLIHDPEISSLVGQSAVYALHTQVLWAERSKEQLAAELKALLRNLNHDQSPLMCAALMEVAFDLHSPELEGDVRDLLQRTDDYVRDVCAIELVAGALRDGNPWRLEEMRESHTPIDAMTCVSDWLQARFGDPDYLDTDEEEEDGFPVESDPSGADFSEQEMESLFGDGRGEDPEMCPGWAEELLPKPKPFVAPPKVGRNDPCPCGSGKKHKKCCGSH